MFRVGLTGGIASGKSTVAEMFVELGASLVDTDVIARAVVAPGSAALEKIRAAFGAVVLVDDGSLDRRALREIVFSDAAKRRELEAITHPEIRSLTLREIASATGPYVIVAVPLLVESGFSKLVDRVAVVHCTREQQIARLIERDDISREQALAMISAQVDEATRLQAADDVIDNSKSISHTRDQVTRLHAIYLKKLDHCRAAQGTAE